MFYIVGLGNPGEKYENTRHNVGRIVVRAMAGEVSWEKSKHANALYAWGEIAGTEVGWILPETFMNKSGDTIRYVVKKHEANPGQIIVIYDDVDLALGEIKLSKGRGDGGHNGIKSIIGALGTKEFMRVRVGIAPKSFWTGKVRRPAGGAPMTRHVLGRFSRGEEKVLAEVNETVAGAIKSILTDGIEKAMNHYN